LRVTFHELIHCLFAHTGDPDILHEYLKTHGGYFQNQLVDLEAVYVNEVHRYLLKKKQISLLEKLLELLTILFKGRANQ
jgi:hypothetical protein